MGKQPSFCYKSTCILTFVVSATAGKRHACYLDNSHSSASPRQGSHLSTDCLQAPASLTVRLLCCSGFLLLVGFLSQQFARCSLQGTGEQKSKLIDSLGENLKPAYGKL